MLYLKRYSEKDLWFKKQMNEDEKTMSYNAGYNIDACWYNNQKGTIIKTDEQYLAWLENWNSSSSKDRGVWIIVRESDETYIGEVCYHKDDTPSGYDLGIVIYDEFRGQGYAKQAMRLLLNEVYKAGIKKVNHSVPRQRLSAVKTDLAVGFKESGSYFSEKFDGKEEVVIFEIKLKKDMFTIA